MECSIPTFPEIKAPLLFKKALALEKRREGLHAMFSKMFEEFTRECFFSPLLISFFGGDISNVNITEDSQCSLSPIPPSLVTKAAGLGASETRMQPDTSADHGAAHHIDKSDSSRKLIAKTTSSALDMPIDMQGELWYQNKQKTNGVNDQWKKRYFSTDSSGDKAQLYMWKDENKGTLLNSLHRRSRIAMGTQVTLWRLQGPRPYHIFSLLESLVHACVQLVAVRALCVHAATSS